MREMTCGNAAAPPWLAGGRFTGALNKKRKSTLFGRSKVSHYIFNGFRNFKRVVVRCKMNVL